MKIAVASGKGGTGKTTVAVNLFCIIEGASIADCDVEEPNASLFLKPEIIKKEDFGISVPLIDRDLCDYCRLCAEKCRYNAIAVLPQNILVFEQLCHGCGLCSYVCPKKAIKEKKRVSGVIEYGRIGERSYIGGILHIKEAMPTPLIREIKKKLNNSSLWIIDSPPGISCPVMEAVKDTDYVVIVTEPTPFGLEDLKIAVETFTKMGLNFGVIVNKYEDRWEPLFSFLEKNDISVIGKIPFDREIARLYAEGKIIVEEKKSLRKEFEEIKERILNEAKGNSNNKW